MDAEIGRVMDNQLLVMAIVVSLPLVGFLILLVLARIFGRLKGDDKTIVKIGDFEMTLQSVIASACILAALLLAISHIDQLCSSCDQVRTAEMPPLPRAHP